mmetsp:Transcript_26001/g.64385  ORF Transcript_26001/g.64385 Transcript_26001/m.64385 type:complete len:142 (-) Transcript_26001:821-1246(-)
MRARAVQISIGSQFGQVDKLRAARSPSLARSRRCDDLRTNYSDRLLPGEVQITAHSTDALDSLGRSQLSTSGPIEACDPCASSFRLASNIRKQAARAGIGERGNDSYRRDEYLQIGGQDCRASAVDGVPREERRVEEWDGE